MRTLSHRQARYLAQATLDGELSAEHRTAFEAHLAGCPECRAYAAEMSRLEAALQQLGDRHRRQPRAVPDFTGAVRLRLQREAAPSFWLRLTGGLAQAASLVIVTALTWQLLSSPRGSFEGDPADDTAANQSAAGTTLGRSNLIPAVEFDEEDAAPVRTLTTPPTLLWPAPTDRAVAR